MHAADGYARATGRLGVAITSTGPGAANAVGGLFEAHFSSSPVLMLTGQVETPWVGQGRGALHEADDQIEMLRTVTRRAESVRHHGEIAATVVRCGVDALHRAAPPGRGRDPDRPAVRPRRGRRPRRDAGHREPPADAALRARRRAARRRRTAAAVGRRRRHLAPTPPRRSPRSPSASAHPCSPPSTAAARSPRITPSRSGANSDRAEIDPMIADADVVLAVGTRFQMTGNIERALTIPGRLIHVDVDPTVIGRNHRADVAVVGDARLTLEALTTRLALASASTGRPGLGRTGTRRARRRRGRDPRRDGHRPREDHGRPCAPPLPRDAIVVKDSTSPPTSGPTGCSPVYEPRTAMRPAVGGDRTGSPAGDRGRGRHRAGGRSSSRATAA